MQENDFNYSQEIEKHLTTIAKQYGGFSDICSPLAEESCPKHYKGDYSCLNLIMQKGRIIDSLQFIATEIKEFEQDYIFKSWKDYKKDRKLQKLMDRTSEKIFIAQTEDVDEEKLEKDIKELEVLAKEMDTEGIIRELKEIVPSYKPNRYVLM